MNDDGTWIIYQRKRNTIVRRRSLSPVFFNGRVFALAFNLHLLLLFMDHNWIINVKFFRQMWHIFEYHFFA